jgi:Dyp-type peroxidase family
MNNTIDLHDIQGNIVKGYGRFGYPKARYVFFKINNDSKGRKFVGELAKLATNSAPWDNDDTTRNILPPPPATTNVGFTFQGLKAVGVPMASLQTFPQAFAMGMKARRAILGDDGPSAPEHWDPIWTKEEPVHIWISINGRTEQNIEDRYQEIQNLVESSQGGVEILCGHRGDDGADNLPYQSASAIFKKLDDGREIPTPKEHFGYTDGISDPDFIGASNNPLAAIGAGKPTGKDPKTVEGWAPLETGEFILGHRDEAYEYPKAPQPPLLAKNGTFMVYRKLHENVGAFNQYIEEMGKDFPGGKEALAAKFAGRWRNGAPLTTFGTEQEAQDFVAELDQARKDAKAGCPHAKQKYNQLKSKFVAFDYNDDLEGSRCPIGAHARRVNPRGALEFGVKGAYNTPGALINRRRILRRGLPYGESQDPSSNDGNHGIIFMALNADIERQFEFVQQQWIVYGNDFKQSNQKDPILGNHGTDKNGCPNGQMAIEGDGESGQPPFFCARIPRLVEVRGGDYFFLPSMTALHMLAEGIIDPT